MAATRKRLMQRYSITNSIWKAMRGNAGWQPAWHEPKAKSRYDVVVIGSGGHGLATAYYLARKHCVRNVAVLEKGWIGGGNSGRNTQVTTAPRIARDSPSPPKRTISEIDRHGTRITPAPHLKSYGENLSALGTGRSPPSMLSVCSVRPNR
jgi:choline dehydrogenase-like flavoprotein